MLLCTRCRVCNQGIFLFATTWAEGKPRSVCRGRTPHTACSPLLVQASHRVKSSLDESCKKHLNSLGGKQAGEHGGGAAPACPGRHRRFAAGSSARFLLGSFLLCCVCRKGPGLQRLCQWHQDEPDPFPGAARAVL